MVILITGASHTGKNLLAQRLLEKYHYPYLSYIIHGFAVKVAESHIVTTF